MDRLEYQNGRVVMQITLPLPPTDNNIYFNMPGGGRALTSKARSYITKTKSEVAELAAMNNVEFKQHVPYTIETWVFFEKVETKGWAKGKAKNRYMKVDTGNRSKLIEDSIAKSIGVDDHHFFNKYHHKCCDPDDPRVVIKLEEQEE